MPKTGHETLSTHSMHSDDDMDKQFGATDYHMYGHYFDIKKVKIGAKISLI